MRLSLYTFVRNGLRYDFHVVQMLRHHLGLADEIIVNEGCSTDGTYEKISTIDPKITVFRSEWGEQQGMDWYRSFKEAARRRCTGDWCVYLDCDEFIPEWQFGPLRERLQTAAEDLIPIEVVNFYGNYRVYHRHPEKAKWPGRKVALHRNRPEIEFWGDATNVRLAGQPYEWPAARPYEFCCHHFGYVRHASRLREKWRAQNTIYAGGRFKLRLPAFVFDLMPHRWEDAMFLPDLALYEGPFIAPVREDPSEFVRDDFALARRLERDSKA